MLRAVATVSSAGGVAASCAPVGHGAWRLKRLGRGAEAPAGVLRGGGGSGNLALVVVSVAGGLGMGERLIGAVAGRRGVYTVRGEALLKAGRGIGIRGLLMSAAVTDLGEVEGVSSLGREFRCLGVSTSWSMDGMTDSVDDPCAETRVLAI